jgi:uncharacterized protein YjbI with pentapeptide repeats
VISKRGLFIGLVLGGLIGWALGFLRLPYLEQNTSFLLGFITSLACVALVCILLFVWNKSSVFLKMIGKERVRLEPNNPRASYILVWLMVTTVIVIGGATSTYLIYRQGELLRKISTSQNAKVFMLAEMIQSSRSRSMSFVMNDILNKIDAEIRTHPTGQLSDETIDRIVALCYSFQPYPHLEGDSLSDRKLSPERGQLLQSLVLMKVDSGSLRRLALRAPFAGADLRGADLQDINFPQADLQGADLSNANLRGANLHGANLCESLLIRACLNDVILSGANLKRADMEWAELNRAVLDSAQLDGVDLSNATLKSASLTKADLQWSDLSGVLLQEGNLTAAYLGGVKLTRANLHHANLAEADLRNATLVEANLTNCELSGIAISEQDWLIRLKEWRVQGAEQINSRYEIADHPVSGSRFTLNKRNN